MKLLIKTAFAGIEKKKKKQLRTTDERLTRQQCYLQDMISGELHEGAPDKGLPHQTLFRKLADTLLAAPF